MVEFGTLQNAFYILGIVFMGIMLVLVAALVIMVFVIRAKIHAIQRQIQAKIDEATHIASRSGELLAKVGSRAARNVADKFKKVTGRRR